MAEKITWVTWEMLVESLSGAPELENLLVNLGKVLDKNNVERADSISLSRVNTFVGQKSELVVQPSTNSDDTESPTIQTISDLDQFFVNVIAFIHVNGIPEFSQQPEQEQGDKYISTSLTTLLTKRLKNRLIDPARSKRTKETSQT